MNIEQLCKSFCTGLGVREIPIGLAISTPFKSEDGDSVTAYMRRQSTKSNLVRFEDDGLILSDLAESGFALNTDIRKEAFENLLKSHDAEFDEDENLIHTEFVPEKESGPVFLRFLSLLLRVQDLSLLSSANVIHVFKNDIREFIEQNLDGNVKVFEDKPPIAEADNYVADFVLKSMSGKTLALYAASNESKALESLLLWQEALNRDIEDISILSVFETSKPTNINKRTMARIMNSDVQMAAFQDSERDVLKKLKRNLELQ